MILIRMLTRVRITAIRIPTRAALLQTGHRQANHHPAPVREPNQIPAPNRIQIPKGAPHHILILMMMSILIAKDNR